MRRITVTILILVFFLGGCTSVPNVNSSESQERKIEWDDVVGSLLPSDPVPSEIKLKKGVYMTADVSHVRDGDTIVVRNVDTSYLKDKDRKKIIEDELIKNNGELGVRLISIDTPEITNGKNEYFGKEAKEAVAKLLYSGKVVLELDPAILYDDYSRLIAHTYTMEGINVQKYLLSNGLARVAYLYDDYKYTSEYRHAEKEAKAKKLNIHSINGYVKWDEIAGFDMSVPVNPSWDLMGDPPPPEKVVERMGEIDFSDFFNFGISGSK